MEKLRIEDYKILIELVEKEKNSIHKQAIHDKELREKEIELDFIIIELVAQLNILEEYRRIGIKKIQDKLKSEMAKGG